MNNVRLYVALGVPLFSLLIVFLANNRAVDALRSEMREGFAGLHSRLDRMENRLDTIDPEVRVAHENRIAVLEERVGSGGR